MSGKLKLTPWRTGSPPRRGWWEVRRVGYEYLMTFRRWWDGEFWGMAVIVGLDDDNTTAEYKRRKMNVGNHAVEWRGLAEPPKGRN